MGQRYAVGTGSGRQLGTGSDVATLQPWTDAGDQFSFVTNTKTFNGNAQCYLAIGAAGIYGWGLNAYGELGLGDTAGRNVPTLILAGTFISLAGTETCGLAVKSDGTLWGWGANTYGELGVGDSAARTTPVQIGAATDWAAVAGGGVSFLALKTGGTIWSCGDSADGQLGLGATLSVTTFTQIGSGTDWASIHCGYYHCAALTTAGALWMWGADYVGELGTAGAAYSNVPVLKSVGTVTHVALGDAFTVVRLDTNAVLVTGDNTYGQLGVAGTPKTSFTTHPTAVATKVFAGRFSTVLYTGSDIYGTGKNTLYELGIGGGANAADFTLLTALANPPDSFASTGMTSQIILTAPLVAPEDVTDSAAGADAYAPTAAALLAEAASASDTIANSTFTMYLEAIGLSDSIAAGANTTSSLSDSAVMRDVIRQAINQIVADSAAGADSLNFGAALTLVDIAAAVDTQAPSYNSVMMVAELIATLEAYNGADGYDITESGALSDAYVARVEALVSMIEAAQVVDTGTALVHVMQLATDSAVSADSATSAGSLLNALLNDAVLATIRLNIGGELFTGWVLNADTLAPSEYQFADLQFNSACKHGDAYLLAADDGIYQFTEDAGVETVMTYIKTGKTDFGSDMRKSVTNAYMVYSAAGQMVLKVTTSANGALQTNDYAMVPFVSDDTPDPQRVTVGKGLKSRYWQFELTGANAGCKFDEIGMLPVVLSRRI